MVVSSLVISSTLLVSMSFFGSVDTRYNIGSMYDPNDLGLVLVTILPLCMLILRRGSWLFKLLALYTIVMSFYTIILTQSRGAFIALVTVGILFILKERIAVSRKVIIIGICVIVFSLLRTGAYWERIHSISSPGQTGTGRTIIWKRGMIILQDRPLVGVGVANFVSAYGRYLEAGKFPGVAESILHPGKWKSAHNSFVQIGVEMGGIGLALYVILIVRAHQSLLSRKLERIQQQPSLLAEYRGALYNALVGFTVGSVFLSQCYSPLLYTIIALAATVSSLNKDVGLPQINLTKH